MAPTCSQGERSGKQEAGSRKQEPQAELRSSQRRAGSWLSWLPSRCSEATLEQAASRRKSRFDRLKVRGEKQSAKAERAEARGGSGHAHHTESEKAATATAA